MILFAFGCKRSDGVRNHFADNEIGSAEGREKSNDSGDKLITCCLLAFASIEVTTGKMGPCEFVKMYSGKLNGMRARNVCI